MKMFLFFRMYSCTYVYAIQARLVADVSMQYCTYAAVV